MADMRRFQVTRMPPTSLPETMREIAEARAAARLRRYEVVIAFVRGSDPSARRRMAVQLRMLPSTVKPLSGCYAAATILR